MLTDCVFSGVGVGVGRLALSVCLFVCFFVKLEAATHNYVNNQLMKLNFFLTLFSDLGKNLLHEVVKEMFEGLSSLEVL